MKTREEIIASMCYTSRHDYGLHRPGIRSTNLADLDFNAGMTSSEQKDLWDQMAKLFDRDIAPYMEFRKD
jgi:hypothetical protein